MHIVPAPVQTTGLKLFDIAEGIHKFTRHHSQFFQPILNLRVCHYRGCCQLHRDPSNYSQTGYCERAYLYVQVDLFYENNLQRYFLRDSCFLPVLGL